MNGLMVSPRSLSKARNAWGPASCFDRMYAVSGSGMFLTRIDVVEELGDCDVEFGRDPLIHFDRVIHRPRQGLVFDHGNAVAFGDLPDLQGDQIGTLREHEGSAPGLPVVADRHR